MGLGRLGAAASRTPNGLGAAGHRRRFLVLSPVLQLQWRAFLDGGSAFARMQDLPRIGTTLSTTVVLAILSSILAVLMGTLLAWCASMLPQRVRRIGSWHRFFPWWFRRWPP